MRLPPSVRLILPSLQILEDRAATLAIADIKEHLPSLRIRSDSREVMDAKSITISLDDLRKLLPIALASVEVDEKWYVAQVPGLGEALKNGAFASASEHYCLHGYLEGRPPRKPTVDEDYYLKNYPDVAQAVNSGKERSAHEHYVTSGYAEGRNPVPPSTERTK